MLQGGPAYQGPGQPVGIAECRPATVRHAGLTRLYYPGRGPDPGRPDCSAEDSPAPSSCRVRADRSPQPVRGPGCVLASGNPAPASPYLPLQPVSWWYTEIYNWYAKIIVSSGHVNP